MQTHCTVHTTSKSEGAREREREGWGGRNDEQGDRSWGRSSRIVDQREREREGENERGGSEGERKINDWASFTIFKSCCVFSPVTLPISSHSFSK